MPRYSLMSMPEAAAELIAGAAEAIESKWGFESESLPRGCCSCARSHTACPIYVHLHQHAAAVPATMHSPVLVSPRGNVRVGCFLPHVQKQWHCISGCDGSGKAGARGKSLCSHPCTIAGDGAPMRQGGGNWNSRRSAASVDEQCHVRVTWLCVVAYAMWS